MNRDSIEKKKQRKTGFLAVGLYIQSNQNHTTQSLYSLASEELQPERWLSRPKSGIIVASCQEFAPYYIHLP